MKFFVTFGIYFFLISAAQLLFERTYLYFLIVEFLHFILAIAVAFLFSAFLAIRFRIISKTYFWSFVASGLLITIFTMASLNPNVKQITEGPVFFNKSIVYFLKSLFFGVGFLLPAVSFLQEGIKTKEKLIAKRSFLFSLCFAIWAVGGFLHSQYQKPYLFILGDFLLVIGSLIAGNMMLGG